MGILRHWKTVTYLKDLRLESWQLRVEPRYSNSQAQRPTEDYIKIIFIISVIKNNFHYRIATVYLQGQDQAEAI